MCHAKFVEGGGVRDSCKRMSTGYFRASCSLCFSIVFAALANSYCTVYFYRRGEFAENYCGDISREIQHR